jgi:hypothetical protein
VAPHPEGEFVELETEAGENRGPAETRAQWRQREDGLWCLGPFAPISALWDARSANGAINQVEAEWGGIDPDAIEILEGSNDAAAEAEREYDAQWPTDPTGGQKQERS